MSYHPGKHIIATLEVSNPTKLCAYQEFQQLIDELITVYRLKKLGEVYHNFEPGGFTAVVCLSESHISIHTWPEHLLVNLDIYLSNFERDNDGTVTGIYKQLQEYFGTVLSKEQIITR